MGLVYISSPSSGTSNDYCSQSEALSIEKTVNFVSTMMIHDKMQQLEKDVLAKQV